MAEILIIDDCIDALKALSRSLERIGHGVIQASSFVDGLTKIKSPVWDVALVDIVLENESGIDLLREARSAFPDNPVLIITGAPCMKTAKEAVRFGAFDYVEKPIKAPFLEQVVERALKYRDLLLDRCRLEMEKTQALKRLETIFDSVQDGIITVDQNNVVLALNSSARSLFHLNGNDAVGLSLEAFCKNTHKAVTEAVKDCIQKNEPFHDYQVTGITNHGLNWTYMISASPLNSSQRDGAVIVIRDITRLRALEEEVLEKASFANIVGRSRSMLEIFDQIRNLAETDTTVLIQGESGTGKELVAEALHSQSPRNEGPLVKVNCSALPENLLESELFGHVRGAFTGAMRDKAGRFELANHGTIFLDEIGDISRGTQQRLLRVIQEREIERVGSCDIKKIDVRIIAATNKNLYELVSKGRFREDLYYRLNVATINLPPLRERPEDIPLLTRHFIDKLQIRLKRIIYAITPEAMEIILNYHWPGNIRQLENALERAIALNRDNIIRPESLPEDLLKPKREIKRISEDAVSEPLRLRNVLDSVGWNRARASERLGVSRTTLWRMMRESGLHKV